jgi:hypothetical protein
MWKKYGSVDALVVDDPEGFQVIIKGVTDQDCVGINERI